ncbi:glycosyltransferase [Micrococcoides hystricis]|uniref:Glycosyltransferase n=1 Tax=Micrococcoides hystricis TaxID=1572761 RepID=A0ABV6PBR5_9MICC
MLVCHRGSEHLPEVLSALQAQTRPVDHLIVVDSAADEDTRRLLEQHVPEPAHLVSLRENQGFTAAVAHAADMAADLGHRTAPEHRWLWLIHDDSAPAEDALAELLGSVEKSPSVTIAGCKQVRWHDDRKLIDVGIGMSPRAERLTMINREEIDQDQYEDRSDVFAVNSAGMLVRADSWAELGGFDPALQMVGDELDLCWRNRLAGNRVIVVPSAIMRHDEPVPDSTDRRTRPVSGSWFRPSGKDHSERWDELSGRISPSGIRAQRRSQNFLRLKYARGWQLPFLWLWLLIAATVDLILGIANKQFAHAFKAFVGTIDGLLKPAQLRRSRRQLKQSRRVAFDVVEPLMTSRAEVRHYERANRAATERTAVIGDGTGAANTMSEPTGGHDEFTAMAAPERTWAGTGALVAFAVLTIASVIGLRHLLGASALMGGSMLPVSGSLGAVFAHASSWWTDLSVGSNHHIDPFSYVLGLLGILGIGNASVATVWAFFLAMPLAGLAAWFLAAGLTDSRGIRLLAALIWGVAPVLQVDLAQGRLGAMIFHIVLPLFALAVIRATGSALDPKLYLDPIAMRRTEVEMILKPGINSVPSWTAAGVASLLMAVLAASAPAATLPLALAVIVMFVVIGRRAKTLWFVPLPAIALFLPTWIQDWNNPRALLADPGAPLAFEAAPIWQQLLGFPIRFEPLAGTTVFHWDWLHWGAPFAIITALLIAAPAGVGLLIALFTPKLRGTIVRFAFLTALLSLAVAYLTSGIVTAADGSQPVTIFPGPAISVWYLVLMMGAIVTLDVFGSLRNRSTAGRRAGFTTATGVLLGTMVLSVLLAGAQFLTASFVDPVQDEDPLHAIDDLGSDSQVAASPTRLVPATAADQALGQYRTRTLRITATNTGFDGALINGAATTLDAMSAGHHARQFSGPLNEASWASDDPADEQIKQAVAQIVAGDNLDPRQQLDELAVAFVFLADPANDQELLAAKIDSVPGLATVGRAQGGWLWRAVPEKQLPKPATATDFTSRMRITDANGRTVQQISSTLTEANVDLQESSAERRLWISNRADPDWLVTFNGREINPEPVNSAQGQWAAEFVLPQEAGTLNVEFQHDHQRLAVFGQGLVFVLALLLAVPVSRRARFVPYVGPDTDATEVEETSTSGEDQLPDLAAEEPTEEPANAEPDDADPAPAETTQNDAPAEPTSTEVTDGSGETRQKERE